MANSTPSSVLNELAKSNKVTAHYQVVSEAGPAHQKEYKVHLHVGSHGPFEGIGSSLKNARNAAASQALVEGAPGLHINPTVELNILSMKSGELANYREVDSVSLPPTRPEYDSLFATHQPYHHPVLPRRPRPNRLWRMSITICGRTYIGEGHTKSEARATAASHALLELKGHLIERAKILEIERVQQQQAILHVNGIDHATAAIKPPSAVSKVFEIANRNKYAISFDTIQENGPAHVKMFCVKCKVGNHETLGTGVGKKAAKNDAAEKMLMKLQDLTEIPKIGEEKKKGNRSRQSYKGGQQKSRSESGLDPKLDPITYLTQLMQLRKENAPVYTMKVDAGPQHKTQYGRLRYQMEVAIGEHKAIGHGDNKKIAKANAADNLLKILGLDLEELRRRRDQDSNSTTSSILNMAVTALRNDKNSSLSTLNRAPGSPITMTMGTSKSNNSSQIDQSKLTAKQKLEYLSSADGFQIIFNDFIKQNKNEKTNHPQYTSNLAILKASPVVFQGFGDSMDQSREDAAEKALQAMNSKDGSKSMKSVSA